VYGLLRKICLELDSSHTISQELSYLDTVDVGSLHPTKSREAALRPIPETFFVSNQEIPYKARVVSLGLLPSVERHDA